MYKSFSNLEQTMRFEEIEEMATKIGRGTENNDEEMVLHDT